MNELKINTSIEDITSFFNSHNLLMEGEKINMFTKAGEGNMNLVLRIKTNKRSFIFKQSRPYAEKYPFIKAPIERINTEYSFYKTLINNGFPNNIPNIITFKKDDFFMLLEDLGESDFSDIYTEKSIDINTIETLIEILNNIHSCNDIHNYPSNHKLKKLNHQHIFVLPFKIDNGFDLNSVQVGLKDLVDDFTNDIITLKNKVSSIGDRYLNTGETLLHGDFYPGSWMKNNGQIYLIDPEFSFVGDIEFDYAVFAAHLILITSDIKLMELIVNKYMNKTMDLKLFYSYTGIEIIRRLIGIAQLPLNLTIKEKKNLLYFSKSLILN